MQKCAKYTTMSRASRFANYQRYSTVTSPIAEDEFFNREREKTLIAGFLKGRPRIILYTGPRNCGKTTLLLRCLQDLKVNKESVNVCHIDLREFAFQSETEFKERLVEKLSTWSDSIFNSFKKLSISFPSPLGVDGSVKLTFGNKARTGPLCSCLS